MTYLPLVERFWSFVPDKPDDGCWLWYGSPCFTYGPARQRRWKRAHRMAWELSRGQSVPRGRVVVRTCENERCVRPDHLALSTMGRVIEGTVRRMPMGLKNHNARHSADDVREMRRLYANGLTTTQIAECFDTSRGYVHNVISRVRRDTVWDDAA